MRIIAAEGGLWRDLIELIQAVRVVAVGSLTVRFELAGLTGLPENPAVEEGAFCDRVNGKLYVCVTAGRPDWQALARVVRDEILPGFGPGIILAIKAVLAAQSVDDADADLADYPPLRDEVLAEFERVAEEYDQSADFPDGADWDTDGYDELYEEDGSSASSGEDKPVDDEGDEADAHDNADTQDQQDDGQDGRGSTNNRDGAGGQGGTGGSGTGGTANGRSRDNGGNADRKKRATSGKNHPARPDSQLISYVSPNTSDRAASDSTERSREQHLRDSAGEAGVDLVIELLEAELRDSGSCVEKMPEKNKGYDILVRDANGEPQRYIEVKATAGAWGLRGVGLTGPQFSLARQKREQYWLYVVEQLYQPHARIWWIRDPAGRIEHFHYDHGWQTAAEGDATVTGAPNSDE